MPLLTHSMKCMVNKKTSNNTQINTQQTHDDDLIFRDAVADVRPMKSDGRIEPVRKRPLAKPLNRIHDDEFETESTILSDPADLRDVEVGDELFFARAGIQLKLQKKLRRGELPIEDELDLHGYTSAEAKIAITDFIQHCKQMHIRVIRIIHGKGYRSQEKLPVLKTYVAYWLPQHKDVLGFSSARQNDGGTGAVYVLLKK